MKEILDAFWRAAGYCLLPRVIVWSLLPLVVAVAGTLGLGWFYWEPAVAGVRQALDEWSLTAVLLRWLESIGAEGFKSVIAPVLVLALAVPVVVVASLLLVAWLMTPALVAQVVARRFPGLERRGGAGAWWMGIVWSLGCTAVALIALLASLPLWLLPPLALVLPPLIWGWLAARVFSYDALALHATPDERRLIVYTQRWPLLGMGVLTGLIGSAPAVVWTLGVVAVALAPLLVALSIWLYTLVFAFASLWFAHFTLARLHRLRSQPVAAAMAAPVAAERLTLETPSP